MAAYVEALMGELARGLLNMRSEQHLEGGELESLEIFQRSDKDSDLLAVIHLRQQAH